MKCNDIRNQNLKNELESKFEQNLNYKKIVMKIKNQNKMQLQKGNDD